MKKATKQPHNSARTADRRSLHGVLADFHAEVVRLASKNQMDGLVSDDPEDDREAWEDGQTPNEYLNNIYDAAVR